MTHSDIYTKFMIEYDKANITSSYPSLTKTEIAAILNKAYLALISLKISGNNPRKVLFELDIKAIHDLQLLIVTEQYTNWKLVPNTNEVVFNMKGTEMYIIQALYDKETAQLIDHFSASKFRKTSVNYPWIELPVFYIQNNEIHILVDAEKNTTNLFLDLTYVKTPNKFANTFKQTDKFELSDYMAEELINLAILFATENTESPRLQTKSSLLSLES